jgi:purine-binding chemotaxis protein CheW
VGQVSGGGAGTGVQVVGFVLGGELHGLPVSDVDEVVEDAAIHPLPRGGPALLGILRLRGELIPVFDVGPALGLPPQPREGRVVVVVRGEGDRAFGVAADAADDVLSLPQLHQPPGGGDLERILLGVGRAGGRLVTVLDPAGIVRGITPSAMQADP